jgi:uncharacterized protein YjbJ (UPF0337 family)
MGRSWARRISGSRGRARIKLHHFNGLEPSSADGRCLAQSAFARAKRDLTANRVPQTNRRRAMNWDRIEGNWKQFQGKVRQQWAKLTDDDVELVKGKRTELAGRIQQRYGVAQDEAERQIDTWMKQIN